MTQSEIANHKSEIEPYLRQNQARYLADLFDLLRIPSVSRGAEHAPDVQRAAEWVRDRLAAAGVEGARVMATAGHPIVYGEWLHAPDKPTVLIYGHFDVQPAEPFDAWGSPPFEPTLRDGRVVARGASDSKGNLLLPIAAVEAHLRVTGTLPINVKFLFEGEEELGSPHLPAFVSTHAEQLACDLALNSDSLQWSEDEPALLMGLRGVCGAHLDVRGASADLHSGLYGGAVANPLHALAALLASLHGPDGRVAVAGFYDEVVPLGPEARARIAAVPFDEAAFKAQLGVGALVGEPGYSTHERLWARPTLEVVGAWGGYQGEGLKTIVPSTAHAKLTCRLVPDQEPSRVLDLIEQHIEAHAPPGVTVRFRRATSAGYPYLIPVEHPGNEAARAVLAGLYGREPYYVRMGGSVPVAAILLRHLGVYSVSFGFGLPDENFHAPDEFFRLASFERGQIAYARLLETLAAYSNSI